MLLHLRFQQYLGEVLGSATPGQAERMKFKAQVHAQASLEVRSKGLLRTGEVTLYRRLADRSVPSRMHFTASAEKTPSAFSISLSASESQFDRLLSYAVAGNVVLLTVQFAEQPDRLEQPDALDAYMAEEIHLVWHADASDSLEIETATFSIVAAHLLSQVPELDF